MHTKRRRLLFIAVQPAPLASPSQRHTFSLGSHENPVCLGVSPPSTYGLGAVEGTVRWLILHSPITSPVMSEQRCNTKIPLPTPAVAQTSDSAKSIFSRKVLRYQKASEIKTLRVIPSLPDAGSAFRVPAFVAAIMSSLSASYFPTVHSCAGVAAADSTTKTRATKRLLILPACSMRVRQTL